MNINFLELSIFLLYNIIIFILGCFMITFFQILFLFLAYLFGSIPFGLIIGLIKGIDIRKIGSKNIGSTNVGRALGKKYAVLTFILDMIKGALFVVLFRYNIIDNKFILLDPALYGFVAMLGHSFPIFLKFKGGKAVATGAGFIFAYIPISIPVGIISFLIIIKTLKISSVGSLLATFLTVLVGVIFTIIGYDPITSVPIKWYFIIFAILALTLIYIKHIPNIKRLIKKEELKPNKIA